MAKGNLYRERSIEATRLHQGTLSETKRRIAKLYEQAAEDLASTAGRAKSSLTRQWANSYIKEMRGRIGELWQDVGDLTQRGMAKEAPRGVAIQTGLLGDAAELAHLDLKSRFAATFARTPDEAIAAVAQGKLYSGPKAILSKRIWNNADLQAGKIEEVILQGLAKQQSPVQLAKALQAYVNPKAAMPDVWNDIYEGCPFPLRVDYNAKRLAVTSINHAYYSAAILTGRDNPFAVGIQWELSKFHVIYDVCDLYMEHDEGLGIGVYSFDNAPIPHPFCKCNWYVTEGERSLEEIARELHRWTQGESNPKLDRALGEWNRPAQQTVMDLSYYKLDTRQAVLTGVGPEAAQEVTDMIQDTVKTVTKDFPILKKHLKKVTLCPVPMDQIGLCSVDMFGSHIKLDSTVFASIQSIMQEVQESVTNGHSPFATGPSHILLHEIGHAIVNALAMKGVTPLNLFFKKKKGYDFNKAKAAVLKDISSLIKKHNWSSRDISAQLGWRARYNSDELVAQSVASVYNGGVESEIAKIIVNYLKKNLG